MKNLISRHIGLRKTLLCLFCFILIFPTSAAYSGSLLSGRLDNYRYRLYLPSNHDPEQPYPLLVVLHGCKQNAGEMIKGTRFNKLADLEQFVVLYPETNATLSNPFGCWIWWNIENQRRHHGEPRIIVAMIDNISRLVEIDKQRIYVSGISSGGSMSAILASLYPDVFAAAGIHSGLEYGAATTTACGLKAMRKGGPNPENLGELAYHLQGNRHRVVPIIVIQGEEDSAVDAFNADQLIAQFAQTNDFSDDADGNNDSVDDDYDDYKSIEPEQGYSYTVYDYHDKQGAVIMQKILVENLEHAWSGGDPAGSYTDPDGPNASVMMWNFFKHRALTEQALNIRPMASCTEKLAPNFLHFSWYRSMSYKEYGCDPWLSSWRFHVGDSWGSGRCPTP